MSDNKLDRILDKLETLDSRIDKMDVHMAEYNGQLQIHIKGVQLLDARAEKIESRIAPIEKAYITIMTAATWLVGLAGLLAALKGIGAF